MSRRRTALAAALSILVLGSPFMSGCGVFRTGVGKIVLTTSGKKYENSNYKGAIEASRKRRPPNLPKTYRCPFDEHCHTHWCYMDAPLLYDKNQIVDQFLSIWRPCYLRKYQDGPKHVSGGGTPWFGWSEGALGAETLKGFWVRDLKNIGDYAVTNYGEVTLDDMNRNCYRLHWEGKYWGTYCIKQMED
ncbi:hypothetical protein [Prochlorococcus marinus]|uniref:Lipoprotein n=1 Tax=Prochlorococcus marinus (strain MIT 9303) TaxID=59922 RepID=A2CBC0_PROM3|nr:hypothetical protein [Prochlorococcus marinus]ABM78780.1 Hypothetical protein P9303_20401 [Prochlorococcus marinus str. MIT 9303]